MFWVPGSRFFPRALIAVASGLGEGGDQVAGGVAVEAPQNDNNDNNNNTNNIMY